jgi:hypothetical protein
VYAFLENKLLHLVYDANNKFASSFLCIMEVSELYALQALTVLKHHAMEAHWRNGDVSILSVGRRWQ